MAANGMETGNSNVDELVRQVWPGSWGHKAKGFWGRILSQINLKGQKSRLCDVCCAGGGKKKSCSYLARAPPAGRHSELRLLVSLQRRQNCLHSTENRAGLSGRVPRKAHKKSKRCGSPPQPQSTFVTVLCSQINYKAAGKNDYADCCFAGEKLESLGGRRPFYGAQPQKGFLNYTHMFIALDCGTKSPLSF